jgi:hypothetical protein
MSALAIATASAAPTAATASRPTHADRGFTADLRAAQRGAATTTTTDDARATGATDEGRATDDARATTDATPARPTRPGRRTTGEPATVAAAAGQVLVAVIPTVAAHLGQILGRVVLEARPAAATDGTTGGLAPAANPAAGAGHAPHHAGGSATTTAPTTTSTTAPAPTNGADASPTAPTTATRAAGTGPTAPTSPTIDSPATAGHPATRTATAATAATAPSTDPVTPTPPADTTALTPLEQAVHELLSQLPGATGTARERDTDDPRLEASRVATTDLANTPAVAALTSAPTLRDVPHARAVAVTVAPEARPVVEQPQSPNHLHLVIGDDANRVVVTVAVRGDAVNVAVRGGDEQTAAALARNATVLDDAMRGRGLALTDFASHRDAPERGDRDRDDPRQRREPPRDPAAPTFQLT